MTWGMTGEWPSEMPAWRWYPGLLYPNFHVSTANGMQDQPNSWHLGPLKCSLRVSAARTAAFFCCQSSSLRRFLTDSSIMWGSLAIGIKMTPQCCYSTHLLYFEWACAENRCNAVCAFPVRRTRIHFSFPSRSPSCSQRHSFRSAQATRPSLSLLHR